MRTCNFTACCQNFSVSYPDDFRFGTVVAQLQPTGALNREPSAGGVTQTPNPPAGSGSPSPQQSVVLPVVGAVLGAGILVSLGMVVYFYRRAQRSQSGSTNQPTVKPGGDTHTMPGANSISGGPWGMYAPTQEFPEGPRLAELPTARPS